MNKTKSHFFHFFSLLILLFQDNWIFFKIYIFFCSTHEPEKEVLRTVLTKGFFNRKPLISLLLLKILLAF